VLHADARARVPRSAIALLIARSVPGAVRFPDRRRDDRRRSRIIGSGCWHIDDRPSVPRSALAQFTRIFRSTPERRHSPLEAPRATPSHTFGSFQRTESTRTRVIYSIVLGDKPRLIEIQPGSGKGDEKGSLDRYRESLVDHDRGFTRRHFACQPLWLTCSRACSRARARELRDRYWSRADLVNLAVDRSSERRGRSCHVTSIHDRRVRVAGSTVRFRLRTVASARPARPPSFKTNRSTNTRRGFKWALRASRRRAPSSTPFAAYACAPAFDTLQRARTGGWITSRSSRSHYQFTYFLSRSPATSRAPFDRVALEIARGTWTLGKPWTCSIIRAGLILSQVSENAPACDDCHEGPVAAQQRYRDREYATFQRFVKASVFIYEISDFSQDIVQRTISIPPSLYSGLSITGVQLSQLRLGADRNALCKLVWYYVGKFNPSLSLKKKCHIIDRENVSYERNQWYTL